MITIFITENEIDGNRRWGGPRMAAELSVRELWPRLRRR